MKIKLYISMLIIFFSYNSNLVCYNQSYSLFCNESSLECKKIHFLCKKVGMTLFDIWFQLDLFYSVSISYDSCEEIYNNIYSKISIIIDVLYDILKTCSNPVLKKHHKDLESILVQLSLIYNHQIINHVDLLNKELLKCKTILLILIS